MRHAGWKGTADSLKSNQCTDRWRSRVEQVVMSQLKMLIPRLIHWLSHRDSSFAAARDWALITRWFTCLSPPNDWLLAPVSQWIKSELIANLQRLDCPEGLCGLVFCSFQSVPIKHMRMIRGKGTESINYLTSVSLYTLWKEQSLLYILLLLSYLLLLYYITLCLYLSKEFECFSTTGCLWSQLAVYYCPWNGFPFLCVLTLSIHCSLSHTHVFFFFFFFCSCSIYLLLRPLTMTLSPSLPPDVCLNPSLSLSVYLPPSPMRHRSFSSGNELFCLLSLILSTGNNSLSSPPSSPPPLYLAGYIGSSVRCLGLWQPVSYSKWFWHSSEHEHHKSVYSAHLWVCVCVRACVDVYRVCAQSD